MIKVFVLTMVVISSNGGGGITTTEFPLYDDCQAAARAFVQNSKVSPITYANAWCVAKNKPVESK